MPRHSFVERLIFPNAKRPETASARRAAGQRASIVGIVCNLLLVASKGGIGLVAGSVSLVADALNNLTDAASNIVSLIGFHLAGKPADEEHPFGHGRSEYLAGLVVAVLVAVVGIELMRGAFDKIIHPQPIAFSPALVAVLVISIAVKLWMRWFYARAAALLDSETLIACSVDSRNDALATSAVLISLLIAQVTGIDLDGWAGMGVGIFILASSVSLIRETMSPLLGTPPSPEQIEHIRRKILSYPGVLGTHDLMVHDYGPGRQFASAHVEMAAESDPIESHDVIDRIEHDFAESEGLSLILHYDPIVTNDPGLRDLRNQVANMAKSVDPRIRVHDVRFIPGAEPRIVFDCERPQDLPLTDAELRRELTARIKKSRPEATCSITIDKSFLATTEDDTDA